MRTHSKKSPQIYLPISEAVTKATVCKKSKTQNSKFIYTKSKFTIPDFSKMI